jgi:hypothetical protein
MPKIGPQGSRCIKDVMKQLSCRKCKSTNVRGLVQIFVNDTKHLKIICRDCGHRYLAPKEFINKSHPIEESKKKNKARQLGLRYFGLE